MSQEVKLDDLYQEVILDHNKKPRNFGPLPSATHRAHGRNPLCGDEYHLYLDLDANGKITSLKFEGQGCAISKASASLLTTSIEHKSIGEALEMATAFTHLLTGVGDVDQARSRVGKLKFFEGVKNFPVRVKCATLIWRTLEAALKNKPEEVSTEKRN